MRRVLPLATALLLVWSAPAFAWDPFDEGFIDPGPPIPADPAAFVVPEGLYLVTEVYTGDVVTTSGPTTTYGVSTASETPGTFARVIGVVGTGEASALDGSSFNGRAAMADGRAVAGTYYEDFVLTAQGFVSVNVVFFQDDSLTRASASAPAPPSSTSGPALTTSTAATTSRPAPLGSSGPVFAPVSDAREPEEPNAPARPGRAEIVLTPNGPALTTIEVLRARPVRLWMRALDGTAPVAVRSWRMVSGYADGPARASGSGADPWEGTWLRLAPAGEAWTLRFEITSDAFPGRILSASVAIIVRAPALVE